MCVCVGNVECVMCVHIYNKGRVDYINGIYISSMIYYIFKNTNQFQISKTPHFNSTYIYGCPVYMC